MTDYINDLFNFELESGRLDYESDPGYRDALRKLGQQYDAVWQAGDHKLCEALYSSFFDLVYFSSRASFRHGMRLSAALMGWGWSGF